MQTRLISLIVPVRNAAHWIGPLLDQLEALTLPAGWEKEIVVGYQASRDDTRRVLHSRGCRVVESPTLGPAANRNAAAAVARGELLYFIDADARPARPDLLEEFIAYAESLTDLGACGGPILIDPAQTGQPVAQADHAACWYPWPAHRPTGPSPFQPSASLLIPRAVFEQVGGFDEDLRVFEDYECQQRIQAAGFQLYFLQSAPIYHHARERLTESLQHSWQWGRPMRREFLKTLPEKRFAFQDQPNWFWVNTPLIFLSRLRIVLSLTWKQSKGQTLISLPFLALTVGAWALGAAFGLRDRVPDPG